MIISPWFKLESPIVQPAPTKVTDKVILEGPNKFTLLSLRIIDESQFKNKRRISTCIWWYFDPMCPIAIVFSLYPPTRSSFYVSQLRSPFPGIHPNSNPFSALAHTLSQQSRHPRNPNEEIRKLRSYRPERNRSPVQMWVMPPLAWGHVRFRTLLLSKVRQDYWREGYEEEVRGEAIYVYKQQTSRKQ